MDESNRLELNPAYYFDNESKHKIGAVTYIVTAHFDDKQDHLKTKITNLLQNEVTQNIDLHSRLS